MADQPQRRRGDDDLLEWFTVSYRTIVGVAAVVVLLLGAAAYFYFFAGHVTPAAPAASSAPLAPTARFTSIEGSVQVKAYSTVEWVNADTNTLLRRGDLVRTKAGAAAEITFADGTTVQMRPDSLLNIEETGVDPATRQRRVAVGLSSGDVSYNRSAATGSTQVSTPTVKVTQGGAGRGGLRVAETGETDVRVFSGAGARIETRTGASVELLASEGVRVDASGKAGQKQALPAMPVLQAPPHQTEILYPDPSRGTTLLAWKDVAGSAEYRVMVDFSPYFNRPLVDQKIRETQVALRGLEVGRYYWRVAAVTKDGAEGSFSDFSLFSITRPASGRAGAGPPPPLVVESLEVRNNILQIKGRSEPGATVTVNGQRVEVQADGSFNEFVTLDKAGPQAVEIRAVGLNGGVNVKRQSVVVAGL
jgi:hypothetical protein